LNKVVIFTFLTAIENKRYIGSECVQTPTSLLCSLCSTCSWALVANAATEVFPSPVNLANEQFFAYPFCL
jgi:hypothetical protein